MRNEEKRKMTNFQWNSNGKMQKAEKSQISSENPMGNQEFHKISKCYISSQIPMGNQNINTFNTWSNGIHHFLVSGFHVAFLHCLITSTNTCSGGWIATSTNGSGSTQINSVQRGSFLFINIECALIPSLLRLIFCSLFQSSSHRKAWHDGDWSQHQNLRPKFLVRLRTVRSTEGSLWLHSGTLIIEGLCARSTNLFVALWNLVEFDKFEVLEWLDSSEI